MANCIADVRVPFREISLAPTKSMNGEIEANEPVRVYDTSGAWGDADHATIHDKVCRRYAQNGSATAAMWKNRGRVVRPIDDGYLVREARRLAAQR